MCIFLILYLTYLKKPGTPFGVDGATPATVWPWYHGFSLPTMVDHGWLWYNRDHGTICPLTLVHGEPWSENVIVDIERTCLDKGTWGVYKWLKLILTLFNICKAQQQGMTKHHGKPWKTMSKKAKIILKQNKYGFEKLYWQRSNGEWQTPWVPGSRLLITTLPNKWM